jgi:hypothetical protein
MEMLLEPLIKIIFIGIGYLFGFFPVFFGTLGAIEPGPIDRIDDGGKFYRSQGMKFWHITYVDQGIRYMPAELVALLGWILIALIATGTWQILQFVG